MRFLASFSRGAKMALVCQRCSKSSSGSPKTDVSYCQSVSQSVCMPFLSEVGHHVNSDRFRLYLKYREQQVLKWPRLFIIDCGQSSNNTTFEQYQAHVSKCRVFESASCTCWRHLRVIMYMWVAFDARLMSLWVAFDARLIHSLWVAFDARLMSFWPCARMIGYCNWMMV